MNARLPLEPPAAEDRVRRAMLHMLEDLHRDRGVIRDALKRWRDTVDAIRDPLMVHDADLRIVHANRAYADLAGIDPKALVGRPYWECFPKRDGPLPGCVHGASEVCCDANGLEFTLETGETFVSHVSPLPLLEGKPPSTLHVFEDMSEARRAEEKLRLAMLIVENSSSVVLQCDASPGWPITYASANVADWGFDAKTLLRERTPFATLVHPDDLPGLVADVTARADVREDRFSSDFRLLTAGGEARWIEARACAERDASGKIVRYRGVAIDMTERKRTERALAESQRKLSAILDAVTDGIVVVDLETHRYILHNPAFARMLGRSDAEVDALSVDDVLPTDRPDIAADFAAHARGERSFSSEIPFRRGDGSLLFADISSALLSIDDRACIIGVFRDVTERLRADRQIRTLARFPQETPSAIVRIAGDGRILYANPAADALTRICANASRSHVVGDYARIVADCRASGSAREIEIAEGAQVFAVWITPVPAEGYVNLYGIDISKRKAAQQAMAAQLEELQRWQGLNLDREARLLELKAEVNALLGRLNEPARYPSAA